MMWFVLILMVSAAAAQSSDEKRYTLCGRQLAKAHLLYCYGVDPEPTETLEYNFKRSFDGDRSMMPEITKMPERFLYRARRSAAHKLRQSNLLEECCLQPCQVMDLLSHC